MSIRKDCLHYHEEPYMGARVDCCLAETAFGVCPCTSDCENYIPRDSYVRIVRCKDCKHFYFADNRIPQEQRYVCEISGEIWKPDSFCSYGERREE